MSASATSVNALQQALSMVKPAVGAVRNSLLDIVPPDSLVLAQTVEQSLTSGGKYMRPIITLLSGKASAPQGAWNEAHMVEVGAVAEMIHIATLLHDDVIDKSELRRGKRTVSAQFGNKISVLSGDFLLAQASLKLSKLGNTRLVAIFSHVLADLCDGEVEQLQTSYTINTNWDSYYKKTIGKTASLFSAGCESAGVVNGLREEQVQALKTYGRNFGIAFQIVDDLLDYTATEAEMGKPVLDDLRQGLLNAPVLLALESSKLSESEKTALRGHIEALFKAPDEPTIAAIQALLARAEAIADTRALAERFVTEACEAIAFIPDSAEKQALLDLVGFVLERKS